MLYKCLVLGGNGFIGSHLVDELIKKSNSVVVFDRFKNDRYLFEKNKNIRCINGDFLNKSDIKEALNGIDYVFHFISTTSPATAENDPKIDVNTNLLGSIQLFEECVNSNIKKIIFASSGGSVYGKSELSSTENNLTNPVSPYAINKLSIEHYLRYFKIKYKLDSVIFRISNPYGERQPFNRRQGVIPIFLENIYKDVPIKVFGSGEMKRDYIYVKDAVKAITKAYDKKTKFDLYNIGSGLDTSINDLIQLIEATLNKKFKINYSPTPLTYVDKVSLNVGRFESEFGKIAKTEMAEGLKKTYSYIAKEIEYYKS